MNSLSLFVDKLWGSGYKPEPAGRCPPALAVAQAVPGWFNLAD